MQSPTPHSDFFYQVMSRREYALPFFERYLTKRLRGLVDFTQLELCESKHISDGGVTLYSDLLYRCPAGEKQTAYLYAVCEHQSTPMNHMPLRLLEYNVSIMKDHLKQGHLAYPLFANFVLYHGAKPWVFSTSLVDYYEDAEQGAKSLYLAPFTLIDLNQQTDEETCKDSNLGFCFQALKCVYKKDPFKAFADSMNRPIFRDHFHQLPLELRSLTLHYLGLYVDQKIHTLQNLVNLGASNPQEQDNIMTSIAQSYMQKARQEGIQEGQQKGRQEGIQLLANQLAAQGLDRKSIEAAMQACLGKVKL